MVTLKKTLNFISKTSSGMAMGLFSTLIIGTIIKQLCSFGNGFQIGIDVANSIIALMGPGIAVGVIISMKKDASLIEVVSCAALGSIASNINLNSPSKPLPIYSVNGGSNNPLLIYLVIILSAKTITPDKIKILSSIFLICFIN